MAEMAKRRKRQLSDTAGESRDAYDQLRLKIKPTKGIVSHQELQKRAGDLSEQEDSEASEADSP
jgi:hypothetical protein